MKYKKIQNNVSFCIETELHCHRNQKLLRAFACLRACVCVCVHAFVVFRMFRRLVVEWSEINEQITCICMNMSLDCFDVDAENLLICFAAFNWNGMCVCVVVNMLDEKPSSKHRMLCNIHATCGRSSVETTTDRKYGILEYGFSRMEIASVCAMK